MYSGAGFLVDKERGWIVTNAHVASYSSAKITVSFKMDQRELISGLEHVAITADNFEKEITGRDVY